MAMLKTMIVQGIMRRRRRRLARSRVTGRVHLGEQASSSQAARLTWSLVGEPDQEQSGLKSVGRFHKVGTESSPHYASEKDQDGLSN